MVVDTSVLVAIVLEEPETVDLLTKLISAPVLNLSAVSLAEASAVLLSRGGQAKIDLLDSLLARFEMRIIPVDKAQALIAREAFARYGKGRHPAALNLGDWFLYALARYTGEPLLFKGDDFTHTDLLRA